MKKSILFLLLFSKTVIACECPSLKPFSKELSNTYNIIFYGKVDSLSPCSTKGAAAAYFTVNELYKGEVSENVKIDFDCASNCMMSFAKGDEWIIYATYQRFDILKANMCEHSRKYFKDAEQDFYFTAAERTFEEEKKFLKTALGIQPFAVSTESNQQQIEMNPRNEQPSAMNKLWLLIISSGVMLIVYFIAKKKKKNDQ